MLKRVFFLSLATVAAGGFVTGGAWALQGCLSGSCHQDLTKVRYLHGPLAAEMAGAKACVMCHQPAGAKCTAGKGGSFTLKSENLCQTCHDRGTGTQHSQSHVEAKCLLCHDPHGSEISPQMLRAGRK